ncbi:NAD dependent epimerase/dehydratase family protein [Aquimixticola soesokkakensis]|uniref:NAD dependent epimerase/dehydratase family protein n=1 Tax=Aquimixticola soesokkakensis TaxID=1519096 RepID=A0A1Y5R673_9RHOB|nr:SDR family oxidoreductase [Aquimixticola soesokkakensis]SLN10178.1 NAD dependent epimerase/dehydratase family protein [Aquimixticola soesokkakensis]
MTQHLFSFGHGYSAQALAARLLPLGWHITGTTRSAQKALTLRETGITPLILGRDDLAPALHKATHLLVSAAPDDAGDPMLRDWADAIVQAPKLGWIGYLSTTGVYGDHAGGWVDESTPLTPATKRGRMRVAAEAEWTEFAQKKSLTLQIFRLAGIYGPDRGPFAKVRAGTARRIVKQGQVFSRTHVADIAQVLHASIARPNAGAVYNVCDDDPAPPQDVIAYAAELLGLPLPPLEAFETADMTPMARSFYAESKKVRNMRIKHELGVTLIYPDYRRGLEALLALETGKA